MILTSETECNDCIRMNEKFNSFIDFFCEIGYAQYFLTILTYRYMIDFILINRIVVLFHEISTFSHSETKYICSMLGLPISDF